MTYTFLSLLLVFNTVTNLNAAKILAVFPTPSISHQIVFRPLTQELARRGHQVTVITTDPVFEKDHSPPNLTEIDVHDISYRRWVEELRKVAIGSANDMYTQLKMFIVLESAIMQEQFMNKEVRELIEKHSHFDLLLIEACVRPALIFSHIYKAPVIQISSTGGVMGANEVIGAPNHPILYPLIFRKRLYNLTLWEKIRSIYDEMSYNLMYKSFETVEDTMLRKIFGEDTPTLSELHDNVHMQFLNIHPIWYDNVPMPPNVVFMGGLHQKPVKELPKDLKQYLDTSKHGVIYISFGSNVHSSILPPDRIKMMMKVFSELPYDVIWKWDTDLLDAPKNIKVYKWLPQSDLLRHPNLKLFITQGGLQSTDEAITAGVPLIGIPIIVDQWYNTEKYVHHGIGLQLEVDRFTEEEFKNSVVAVIKNESYRNNIIKLRTIIYDQPQTPLERAVWWTEYVIRHGGAKHLRSPAANMGWVKYYELPLVFVLLACVLATFIALFLIVRNVRKCFFTTDKMKKS